ncbi:MAG: DNA-3-methyladenine glycosylase 2 family protein [Oscillospiraceae bacterium]|nr:DNA-3-methyladenine glycosylase 2 family protein [Oscillospiraceae bacterium]
MIYHKHNNEIELRGVTDFDLAKTFECGQCFRWNADENGAYIGIALGRVVRLRKSNGSVFLACSADDFENIWQKYFDLDRDYAKIREFLCVDDFMKKATAFGEGIRILRQDKWEALSSFVISQNNNIPRIRKIIDVLCRNYGEKIYFEEKEYYTYPPASKIALLNEKKLAPLRCGYRAGYLLDAARKVADGSVDLEAISKLTPEEAKAALLKLHGVGYKVADCMLLFGLHMLDAFPRDVWIRRALSGNYESDFDPGVFSPYAGIAQQYMFHYMRNRQ